MSVSCECCVLLGRGLCDQLITRLEESYRLWCVVVCDDGSSIMRRRWSTGGGGAVAPWGGGEKIAYVCNNSSSGVKGAG